MHGQLAEHPLAELIREISAAELSGTLRLERERVKIAIYFDAGALYYASSNFRAHRLAEVLKRTRNLTDPELGTTGSDNDLAATLLSRGTINAKTLDQTRLSQVIDIVRTALLWEDGKWTFDTRARLAEEVRVDLDLTLLLMESARHLTEVFVAARLNETHTVFSPSRAGVHSATLLPIEAFVLSRVQGLTTLSELTALSGVAESDAQRVIYALVMGGLIDCGNWPTALSAGAAKAKPKTEKSQRKTRPAPVARREPATPGGLQDVQSLFDRLDRAGDHYDVLDLGRNVDGTEVKSAYHALARLYHPDLFHQSDHALRIRVDSAFARIAQAYEVLNDPAARSAYDAKLGARMGRSENRASQPSALPSDLPKANASQKASDEAPSQGSSADRAEAAFRKGMAAISRNQLQEATLCLAEAAHLAPHEARYRAQYGLALRTQRQTRRVAEAELQAAVALAPENASYRIMLAELYKELGFRRRAQGEVERALIAEPKNKEARALLASLQ